MKNKIRVLIADDHAIVRSGIRALLVTEKDIEIVGEASDGQEAVDGVDLFRPDVVLMDLEMPQMDGIEAIKLISARYPETQILVLTSFASDDRVLPAIKEGALGYLLKDSGPEALIQAIHQVYLGESSLHPKIARKLIKELAHSEEKSSISDQLTEREVEVLQLVAQGLSNQEIADKLVIGETTVRSHVNNILRKLQLASRTQAALYALRKGYATLEDE